jgi:hypothetical protein
MKQSWRGAEPLAQDTLLLVAAAQGGDQLLARPRDDVQLLDEGGSLALLFGSRQEVEDGNGAQRGETQVLAD